MALLGPPSVPRSLGPCPRQIVAWTVPSPGSAERPPTTPSSLRLFPKLKVPPSDPSLTRTYLAPPPERAPLSLPEAEPPLHAPAATRAPTERTPNSHLISRLIRRPPRGPGGPLHVVRARSVERRGPGALSAS